MEEGLSDEQALAAHQIMNGKNTFIEGKAGSGKSFIIAHIEREARQKRIEYQICAPTGIAALNVNGSTIHSFFKLSPYAIELSDYIQSRRSKSSLTTLSMLIIDEISMVSATLLDLLDAICRYERRKPSLPFGGIQVVLVGDFAQLCPVTKSSASPLYAFESGIWKHLNLTGMFSIQLTTAQRHPDPAFAKFMTNLRLGVIGTEEIEMLQDLSKPLEEREKECYVNDKAVVLESLNAAKDALNARKHAQNPNPELIFKATYTGEPKKMKACLAPDTLSLKIGSPVLHLANNSLIGLLNGSSGEVTGFMQEDGETRPIVKFYNQETESYATHIISRWTWKLEERDAYSRDMKVVASKTQYPLILAYSISVHKSQSSTLDPVTVNLADIFAKSQAYVALSRARSKAGLRVLGLKSFDSKYLRDLFTPDQRVLSFYTA